MDHRKAGFRFILATMFLGTFGFGNLLPVLPDIFRRFNSEPQSIDRNMGYFLAIYQLAQLAAGPVLGALSDRYGRRPILLLSLLGGGLDYVLLAVAPTLKLLFLGRVISGITGAGVIVATSYMAENSDDSNRSANFGLIGAATGCGFIMGPVVGGLLGRGSIVMPAVAAAFLNFLNLGFGWFVFKDARSTSERKAIDLQSLNPVRSLARILGPSPICLLVWVYFFTYLAWQVNVYIWTLYTEFRFHWSPVEIGASLSVFGVCQAVVQALATGPIVSKLGEARTVLRGLELFIVAYALIAWVPRGWMLYALLPLLASAGVGAMALQSMISKDVSGEEQGELQGSLTSLVSLSIVIAPVLYTTLFAWATTKSGTIYPGAPYILASVICLACVVLLMLTRPERFVRGLDLEGEPFRIDDARTDAELPGSAHGAHDDKAEVGAGTAV